MGKARITAFLVKGDRSHNATTMNKRQAQAMAKVGDNGNE